MRDGEGGIWGGAMPSFTLKQGLVEGEGRGGGLSVCVLLRGVWGGGEGGAASHSSRRVITASKRRRGAKGKEQA